MAVALTPYTHGLDCLNTNTNLEEKNPGTGIIIEGYIVSSRFVATNCGGCVKIYQSVYQD